MKEKTHIYHKLSLYSRINELGSTVRLTIYALIMMTVRYIQNRNFVSFVANESLVAFSIRSHS